MTETMGPMEGTTWKACMGLKLTPMVYSDTSFRPSIDLFGHMADTSWTHSKSN